MTNGFLRVVQGQLILGTAILLGLGRWLAAGHWSVTATAALIAQPAPRWNRPNALFLAVLSAQAWATLALPSLGRSNTWWTSLTSACPPRPRQSSIERFLETSGRRPSPAQPSSSSPPRRSQSPPELRGNSSNGASTRCFTSTSGEDTPTPCTISSPTPSAPSSAASTSHATYAYLADRPTYDAYAIPPAARARRAAAARARSSCIQASGCSRTTMSNRWHTQLASTPTPPVLFDPRVRSTEKRQRQSHPGR